MKTRIKPLLILIMVCSVGLWAQFARAAHLKAGQALVIQPPGQFACQTPAEWMNLTIYAEQNDMVAILESLRSEQCFNLIAGTKVFVIDPTVVFIPNPLHPGKGGYLIKVRQAGSTIDLWTGKP